MMKFSRILVPVTGIHTGREAIGLACKLAKQDKSEIRAIYIITPKRDLPLDAEIESEIQKAEDILDSIEAFAKKENFRISTEVLQSRDVGAAIINEAKEREADLILLGVAYKIRYGEFSMGEIVPYILKNSPCRLIIYQSCYAMQMMQFLNE